MSLIYFMFENSELIKISVGMACYCFLVIYPWVCLAELLRNITNILFVILLTEILCSSDGFLKFVLKGICVSYQHIIFSTIFLVIELNFNEVVHFQTLDNSLFYHDSRNVSSVVVVLMLESQFFHFEVHGLFHKLQM